MGHGLGFQLVVEHLLFVYKPGRYESETYATLLAPGFLMVKSMKAFLSWLCRHDNSLELSCSGILHWIRTLDQSGTLQQVVPTAEELSLWAGKQEIFFP